MEKKNFTFVLFFFAPLLVAAQLRLPAVFSDHMVLQQRSSVAVWGWSSPGGEVTVIGSWNNSPVKTKALNTGEWRAEIETPQAGGPFSLTIRAEQEVVLEDVMIGEVWICSGQSNMEWSMAASADGKEALPTAEDSQIRLFHPGKMATTFPQVRGEGTWSLTTPETAAGFSAVAYFFGKRLRERLQVPIGLINVSWGGTPADVWIPAKLITENAELSGANKKLRQDHRWPVEPGVVYNGMIHPLVPFEIAGAIWYQGESNTAAPLQYKDMMTALINGWRTVFGKEFPFYYVQIAPFSGYGEVPTGSLVREQQVSMQSIPRTGMIVISDHVDDVADIHPRFKKPVGERLANYALADAYGQQGIVYKSPIFRAMEKEKNGRVRLHFDNAASGLVSRGGAPTTFMIAGDDRVFYPAKAKIEGSTVVVYAKEVREPAAVRFAWDNGAIPNLFNREGLPVPLFRTDQWPVLKQ